MYNVAEAHTLGHWFTDTCIEYKGRLLYVSSWLSTGEVEGTYHQDRDDYTTMELEDIHIDWSPRLPTGYYNSIRQNQTVWMTQSGCRQYKVGLNERSVTTRSCMASHLGLPTLSNISWIFKAHQQGQSFPITQHELGLQLEQASSIGLTSEVGLHAIRDTGTYYVARNAHTVLGLYENGLMLLEHSATVTIPPYMEVQYVSTEDLLALHRVHC